MRMSITKQFGGSYIQADERRIFRSVTRRCYPVTNADPRL